MNLLKLLPSLVLCLIVSSSLIVECSAQKKFEFGIRFDGLVIPVNFGTYTESGMGYYDINAKGNITQAAYADFTYWPIPHIGVSFGVGLRDFKSEIQYSIPDPYDESLGIVFENSDHVRARGLGPVISIHLRKDRVRARVGYALFDYYKQEFPMRSSASSLTYFDQDVGILAQLDVAEQSYWSFPPMYCGIAQFDIQYNIVGSLFLKLGFETTLSGHNVYPYTLEITGFTEYTTKEVHVLNDFKIRNSFTAFSAGVAYVIGFGKYR